MPLTKKLPACLLYRNGKCVRARERRNVIVVKDDARLNREKYFLKQNDRYVEVFTQNKYYAHRLGQLYYANNATVSREATVITTHDGARPRYFEMTQEGIVIEVYSPTKSNISLTHTEQNPLHHYSLL